MEITTLAPSPERQVMGSLRHGAGVAGNHEINNAQERTSTGKCRDETMEEARRETERVRRARQRDCQRANRRRSGGPAKAGMGILGVREALEAIGKCHAAMEEQATVLEKIVAIQDVIGGQTTQIMLAMEPILKRVAAVEAGLRGVCEVQAAGASQADDVSEYMFRVEGRVEETRSCLKVEQTAHARVEGEVASLQGELLL